MKNFGLIGAAGYVAPKHMKAIKDVGGNLVVALDKSDSVGVLDSYFPSCSFFTETERFERFLYRNSERGEKIDYMSICSPNYLHDSHIRLALRNGVSAICEKPLVVNGSNLASLKSARDFYKKDVNCILQLRLHDQVKKLKETMSMGKKHRVNLEYITSRGTWYDYSWKADISKSGGLPMNIGIHLFDVLYYLFGDVIDLRLLGKDQKTYYGEIELERAEVTWLLSTDYDKLPQSVKDLGLRTYRTLTFGDLSFDFSNGFENLHSKSYFEILKGNGFSIEECEPSIGIVNSLMEF